MTEAGTVDGLMLKYFILKPHGTDQYAKASRFAMRAYARMIGGTNEALAADLREWADRVTPASDKLDGSG